jgi:hypothetical protein
VDYASLTVTPRLEREFPTDLVRQINPKLTETWNFGNRKGLELIPARRIGLLFNAPPLISLDLKGSNDGFGDLSFDSKFGFLARNEEHGNAIITAFFTTTVSTGKNGNGSSSAVVTPTLAWATDGGCSI